MIGPQGHPMFITFEGIDFSGKSTQISILEQRLRERGDSVLLVREPGGTVISEKIRSILLDRAHDAMDDVTEFLLFSASRSQLVREEIIPALDAGVHVIADRFHDSSTAYQGFGRGLDIRAIESVHGIATHGLLPDLTFFIDIPVDASFARRDKPRRDIDRMEAADRAFFERIRDGYRHLAREHASRFVRIDGMLPIDEISDCIWNTIDSRLSSSEDASSATA